jgi:GMP synthase-like glutamine amidotransferase
MRAVVIRHHEEDSAGLIGAAFEACGAQLSAVLFPKEGPLPDLEGVAHIVLLGSTSSVYDEGEARAWIDEELAWVRRADAAGVPVLGICFGAQVLAAAFGGTVEQAGSRELGWVMVDSADPGLIPPGPWMEFHHDRCLPPAEATVLARNDLGVQAYRLGRHLAVQFHPEVDGAQFRMWLNAGGRAEIEANGQDPEAMLAETIAEEPGAAARASQLVASALRIAKESSPEARQSLLSSETFASRSVLPGLSVRLR